MTLSANSFFNGKKLSESVVSAIKGENGCSFKFFQQFQLKTTSQSSKIFGSNFIVSPRNDCKYGVLGARMGIKIKC